MILFYKEIVALFSEQGCVILNYLLKTFAGMKNQPVRVDTPIKLCVDGQGQARFPDPPPGFVQ